MTTFNPMTEPHLVAAEQTIREFATDIRKKITGGASAEVLAAWANKAERARRLLGGTASEADIMALTTEAQLRGKNETAEDLAKLQIKREGAYAQAIAAIDGFESSAHRAIVGVSAFEIEGVLDNLKARAEPIITKILQGADN